MALKFKLKSKDEIPAEFQSLYVERDGAFVLDVDGVADISKLDEFRTNNVGLFKQLDDLKKKFEGIDPEKVRELEAEKLRLEEAQAAAGQKTREWGQRNAAVLAIPGGTREAELVDGVGVDG